MSKPHLSLYTLKSVESWSQSLNDMLKTTK